MTNYNKLWVLLLVLFAATCKQVPPSTPAPSVEASLPWLQGLQNEPVSFDPGKQSVEGTGAAVASAHPLATQAGLAALAAGGSAADALVATSMMLTVVRPQSTGIGGGGFAVVHPSDGSPARAFDFRETAPAASNIQDYLDEEGKAVAQRSRFSGLAVGVPGYIAGLWTMHQRWGKRPWEELVMPAAIVARRGFVIGENLQWSIGWSGDNLRGIAGEVYAPGGEPLVAGGVLRHQAMAQTLEQVAIQGPDAFYQGQVAADIAATAQAFGGVMTIEDLANYEVRETAPLVGEFAGLRIETMPEPSAGGAQVLAMAEMILAWQKDNPQLLDETMRPHAYAEAMRRSYLLRLAYTGDTSDPSASLDDAFAAQARAGLIASFNPCAASPSADLELRAKDAFEAHENTSHVSILDAQGMMISSTHTVNLPLGSGIVSQSGVLLNNELDDFSFALDAQNAFGLAGSEANMIRPGARPVSSMSPSIVFFDDIPRLILGTPGGTRITTTVFQVLSGVEFEGLTLTDAVARTRVHHQAWPDQVSIEEGDAGDVVAAGLEAKGHTLQRRRPWCDVQAIRILGFGEDDRARVEVVADPRGEGMAGLQ